MLLGEVTPAQVAAAQAVTGTDTTGFARALDSGSIRHVIRKHGNRAIEAARVPLQLAITPRDFGRIPRIVSEGTVVGGKKAKTGGRATAKVEYEATLGRYRYLYVEEVRGKARQVAMKTLWKFPG